MDDEPQGPATCSPRVRPRDPFIARGTHRRITSPMKLWDFYSGSDGSVWVNTN